jgi:phenylalanyl-tRNA synthetase beta chain
MKCYTAWLRDFLPESYDATPRQIADKLTASCAVAEGSRDPYIHLDGVSVGCLREAEPIEGSRKLYRCRVATRDGEVEVVCGAPNTAAAVDRRVVYAPPGTRLPFFTVGEREIMGVPSRGVLCSELELGLSADHGGILVLDSATWPVGAALENLRPERGEAVIEFETTPNRPDTLSHLGLARQLAAVDGLKLRTPRPAITPTVADDPGVVSIESPELCRRYVGLIVRGVEVGPSPDWLARRLIAIGHRPISNIVDVTNYILHGLGQPLHAFDLGKLAGGRIVVRRARPGERITTLDGDDCALNEELLVIADAERPVAVAGVMGGVDSGVGPRTRDILLESAHFEPAAVRRAARSLEVHSSSSHLFSRGADPELAPTAARLAAELIRSVAGGRIDDTLYDCHPRPWEAPRIGLRWKRAEQVLGFAIEPDEGRRILVSLGCREEEPVGEETRWRPPSHRPDLAREIDLIEELAQVAGYDNVPVELPLLRSARLNEPDPTRSLHCALGAAGCREVLCTDFVSTDEAAPFGFGAAELVEIQNPLDKGHPFLRPNLFIGLLNAAEHNIRHGAAELRFYEIGRAFRRDTVRPVELRRLSVLLAGELPADGWHSTARELDFYDIRGVLEVVCRALKLPEPSLEPLEPLPAHPHRFAVELDGKVVGVLLSFADKLLADYELDGRPAWGLELELAALLAQRGESEIEHLSPYPPSVRDLALVLDDAVTHERVRAVIESAGGELLDDVTLFDVYSGRQIGRGRRSLAYTLTFRSPERTLTDDEVDDLHRTIVERLRGELGAELRS